MHLDMFVYQYCGEQYLLQYNTYVFLNKGFTARKNYTHIKQQSDGVEVWARGLGAEGKYVGPAEILGWTEHQEHNRRLQQISSFQKNYAKSAGIFELFYFSFFNNNI